MATVLTLSGVPATMTAHGFAMHAPAVSISAPAVSTSAPAVSTFAPADSTSVPTDSTSVPADSLLAVAPLEERVAREGAKADSLAARIAQTTIVADSMTLSRADSLATAIVEAMRPAFRPDPTRALWLSLVLPGAGQIYNHKYWKLPIIYGGFLGCAYALNWNGQMLSDYSQAYLDIMDSDPNTKSYEKMLPLNYNIAGREEQFQEIFKNKKNYYRKYRDMSIMAFAAVYALSVIDAYVDAELSSFDISEDLSLQVQPAVIAPPADRHLGQGNAWRYQGLGLTLSLRY